MGVRERYEERKRKNEEETAKTETSKLGVRERYEQKKAIENMPSLLISLGKDATDVFNDYNSLAFDKDGNAVNGYIDVSSEDSDFADRLKRIESKRKNYLDIITNNRDSFDSVFADKAIKYLSDSDFINGISSVGAFCDYYSQFENEDAYNAHIKNIEEHDSKMIFDTTAGRAEIDSLTQELKALEAEWNELNEKYRGWSRITDPKYYTLKQDIEKKKTAISEKQAYLEDAERLQKKANLESVFDSKSANYDVDSEKYAQDGETYGLGTHEASSGTDGRLCVFGSDVNNRIVAFRNNRTEEGIPLASTYGAGTSSGGGIDERAEKFAQHMTDDEYKTYCYYLGKKDYAGAEEYLSTIEDDIDERKDDFHNQLTAKMATNMPVTSSALSIAANLISPIEYLVDSGVYMVTGKLDKNASAAMSSTIRGTISKNTDWMIGNWDAFDFLYNTTMSSIDSMAATALYGNFGGVSLGLSAAAQGTNDAIERGMNNKQAFWNGVFCGVFECLFESISIGNLKFFKHSGSAAFGEMAKSAKEYIKGIAKDLTKSMIVNASEETLTEIANIAYDTLVNGEFANYTLEDLKSGDTWKQIALQVAEAAGSGALMGFGMGGIDSAIVYHKGSQYANQAYGSSTNLAGKMLELDSENAFAQEMQKKLDAGKKLSGWERNRLAATYETTAVSQDITKIQNGAEQRLTELGETGDVSAIAAALAKQAAGEKLSQAERQVISSSKYGQRVANELNTENIKSGGYSSAWAEKLDTNRINADEYSRLVEDAQLTQETKETNGKAASNVIKAEQAAQTDAVKATTVTNPESRTVENVETGSKSLKSTDVVEAKTKTVTLEDASKKYGSQAQAMIHTFIAGQDVAKYDKAYQAAYDMGKSGVSFHYVNDSQLVRYLTDKQKLLAYEAGQAASDTEARALDAENKAAGNGKKGRKKGVVRGEGVTISDLKKTFNDPQGKAYKYLCAVAEVTGIDIVLYRSEAGPDGKYQGVQGRYSRSEPGTIYIDLNAGLTDIKSADDLAKYAILRTFSHEFTHFIEKWNPIQYNELRKVVFETISRRGENVHDLIEDRQVRNPGMSYDKASREVVAEAMTDILPDANFVQDLAENHKTIFRKLLDQLKEFVSNLREYYHSIGYNTSRVANALKEPMGRTVKYLDSIVQLFDKAAVQAVENYQKTVATENHTDGGITNGAERANQSAKTLHGGRKASVSEMGSGARTEAGDRSGVSEEVGGEESSVREVRTGLEYKPKALSKESFTNPPKGSALHNVQKAFEEYGIECHIVRSSSWTRENPAYTHNGVVYISDQIDADTLATAVPHEMNHVMKQRGFQPYLKFIEKVPDRLNMQKKAALELITLAAEHRGVNIFELDNAQLRNLYDELNAIVYGMAKGGILDNSAYDYGQWIPGAFNDFEGYTKELDDIHAQYKKQFGTKLADANPANEQAKLNQKLAHSNEEQALDSDVVYAEQYQAREHQERKTDRPNRRRALVKGEMINDFHDALSDQEWRRYYDRIKGGKYNPDLFEDNDLATVTVGSKLLLVQMQPNGEFSMIGIWKYHEMLPPEDVIKEMTEYYATRNYGKDEIVSWLSCLTGDDGQKLFIPYNRHSGQYDGIVQQSASGSENTNGILAETRSNGKGLLEVSARSNVAEDDTQEQQRTNTLTDRDFLANAPEGIAANGIEAKRLTEFRDQLAKVAELKQKQQALNAQLDELRASKDAKDVENRRRLQDEAVQTTNRISVLEEKLRRMETSAPLQNILKREKNATETLAKPGENVTAETDKSTLGKSGPLTIKYKDIKTLTAEDTNQWFIDNVKPDYKPPYKPGTVVKEIALTEKTTFVRVYDNMPDGSGMYGNWLMKAEDIEDLTPIEIQNKFALPNIPKYICDVELDTGTHMRVGEVNSLDGWGSGGGTQYDLIGQRIGEFKNERPLGVN